MVSSSWFQRDKPSSSVVGRTSATAGASTSSSSSSSHGLQKVIATCLYPRPNPPSSKTSSSSRTFSSSNSRTIGSTGFGSGGSGGAGGFSPLLLEHGEQVLLDWAVVVYSTPMATTKSSTSNSSKRHGGGSFRSSSSKSGSSHKSDQIQWAQDPNVVQHYNHHPASTTGSSPSRNTTPATSHSQSHHHRHRHSNKTKSQQQILLPDKDSVPTCHLSRMEARLYLCSKSLVVEPLENTKPIVRCPFFHMTTLPHEDIGSDDSSSASHHGHNHTSGNRHGSGNVGSTTTSTFETVKCVDFVVNRHVVIQQNCTGPFDTIVIPTQFRITFLHSSPQSLMELSHILHNQSSHPHTTTPTTTTTLIQPCDRPLDVDHLVDMREQIQIQFQCQWLTPLQEQAGIMAMTNERLYFQPSPLTIVTTSNSNHQSTASSLSSSTSSTSSSVATARVGKWSKQHLVAYARRYHGLRDCAVELYFSSSSNTTADSSSWTSSSGGAEGTSILLALKGRHDREQVIRQLQSGGDIIAPHRNTTITAPRGTTTKGKIWCLTSREFVQQAFDEWQKGHLSNFDYLLALNSAAGRSYHDLSRYPVFPWVIQDYESSKLDLTQETTFRDLSKPVGALNPQRLEYFQKRMASMHDMGDEFLYGTHYSAPGYVLYYLVRSMPEHMLCLQNGKFDAPDRMFHSISQCFTCAMTNHADVKEVLPEFYNAHGATGNFDFLLNTRGLQLGATQTGDRVNDVVLPPWAKSARDFVKKNRKALESPICTKSLPQWIDLIFGCTSRGPAAKEANNLFHSSAYLTPADLDSKSEDERAQAELHATEFGIVPDQLFIGPHPGRDDTVQNDSFLADIGRASDDPSNHATGGGGGGAWELLDHPPIPESTSLEVQVSDMHQDPALPNEPWSAASTEPAQSPPFLDDEPSSPHTNVPLRGRSETAAHHRHRPDLLPTSSSSDEFATPSSRPKPQSPQIQRFADSSPSEWDMKILERKHIHSDAVSGCELLLDQDGGPQSILTTTSLDGGLKVHKISVGASDEEQERKGFPSTLSRFSYSTILSRGGQVTQAPSAPSKLTEYRSHTSRDPLASLVLATDGESGHVAFAGGHDDVVLAYGINSACAVASIYSHRDAVTGLDLIPRTPFDADSALWLEKSTHIMVSGSWDATIKVWSATVLTGEAVTINREPLAELFDADSSIVCVTAKSIPIDGIYIGAGCADGTFCVWNIHTDGMQVVVHTEPARRGSGPCSVVKFVANNGQLTLFAAFSTGVVSSYVIIDGTLQRLSAVSIGVPVLSLVHAEGYLWVGSSDGALRLIPIRYDGNGRLVFDKPTLWLAVNNKSSPGITSISVVTMPTEGRFVCCTGGQDGSVALFELNKRIPTTRGS